MCRLTLAWFCSIIVVTVFLSLVYGLTGLLCKGLYLERIETLLLLVIPLAINKPVLVSTMLFSPASIKIMNRMFFEGMSAACSTFGLLLMSQKQKK